jgi:hypothetical protein
VFHKDRARRLTAAPKQRTPALPVIVSSAPVGGTFPADKIA